MIDRIHQMIVWISRIPIGAGFCPPILTSSNIFCSVVELVPLWNVLRSWRLSNCVVLASGANLDITWFTLLISTIFLEGIYLYTYPSTRFSIYWFAPWYIHYHSVICSCFNSIIKCMYLYENAVLFFVHQWIHSFVTSSIMYWGIYCSLVYTFENQQLEHAMQTINFGIPS